MRFIVFILVITVTRLTATERFPGQIIYFNDTVQVSFDMPTYTAENDNSSSDLYYGKYHKLVYYDSLDNRRILRTDSKLRLVVINMPGQLIELFNVPCYNGFDEDPGIKMFYLMRRIRSGKINLYAYRDRIHQNPELNENPNSKSAIIEGAYHFVIQKYNSTFYTVDVMTLADLSEFFSDCPQVTIRTEISIIRQGGIRLYVDQYNTGCEYSYD